MHLQPLLVRRLVSISRHPAFHHHQAQSVRRNPHTSPQQHRTDP